MIFVAWVIFSILVAMLASSRGRNPAGWFLISIVTSPLIAGLLLLVLSPRTDIIEAENLASGAVRKCPKCAEIIRREAVKCRFCGSDVPPPYDPRDEDRKQ